MLRCTDVFKLLYKEVPENEFDVHVTVHREKSL